MSNNNTSGYKRMATLSNKANDNHYFTIRKSIAIYIPYRSILLKTGSKLEPCSLYKNKWSFIQLGQTLSTVFSANWVGKMRNSAIFLGPTVPTSSLFYFYLEIRLTKRLWSKPVHLVSTFDVICLVHWSAVVRIIYEINMGL